MRRRPIALYIFAIICFITGYAVGRQGAPAPVAHAQTSTRPAVTQLSGRGTATQAWMDTPFCLDPAWWDGKLCSKVKGQADTPAPGFVYKLDLPLPACMAFIGKDALGRWQLSAIPSVNGQCPGDNFALVSGPCLVQPAGYDTPAPPGTPPPAATPSPTPSVATATKPAATSPSTPPASPSPVTPQPGNTAIPKLSPVQERAFSVYCDRTGGPYTMTIWGSYGLTYSVPDDWCVPSRDGARELLRHMAEATPARVEVRP